jgi:peptidyl-prolyl cis-trans isomerase C
MKALITVSTLVCVFLSASCASAADKNPRPPARTEAVAVVNGTVITAGDVQDTIRNAPAGVGGLLRYRKLGLVRALVDQELLYQDAVKKGYDKQEGLAGLPDAQRRLKVIDRYLAAESPAGLAVTGADVKNYYEEHSEKYRIPERVRLSHIFVDKKEDADSLYLRLKQEKGQFARLAALFSAAPSKRKGGDLGYLSRGRLDPALDEAAFSLKSGELAPPVKTKFGYHIILVTDRQPEMVTPFKDVSADIAAALTAEKRKQAVDALLEVLEKNARVEVREEVIDRIE